MLGPMSWLSRLSFVGPGAAEDPAALLGQAAAGDAAAQTRLYRRESGPVFRYLLALGSDEALALDAMQDAFVELLRAPGGFDPRRGTLGAYLAGIARHRWLARCREARRFVEATPDDDSSNDTGADSAPDSAPDQSEHLACSQLQGQVWSGIRSLSWTQREALVLVDLQERPYREAAAIAGVSEDVLRTRLHRARARLAALLGAQGVRP